MKKKYSTLTQFFIGAIITLIPFGIFAITLGEPRYMIVAGVVILGIGFVVDDEEDEDVVKYMQEYQKKLL